MKWLIVLLCVYSALAEFSEDPFTCNYISSTEISCSNKQNFFAGKVEGKSHPAVVIYLSLMITKCETPLGQSDFGLILV
jgi:hypothetical protein